MRLSAQDAIAAMQGGENFEIPVYTEEIRDRLTKFKLESLILAQIERWRRA